MRNPVSRVLYADGEQVSGAVTRAGWDRLLAAWHFLDARYRLSDRLQKGELRAKDLTSESAANQWHSIGLSLREQLRGVHDADYARMYEPIDSTLSSIEDLLDPMGEQ